MPPELDALRYAFGADDADGGEGPTAAPLLGGKYRLLQEIGRGGMGVVYRAERVADGLLVALKVIEPGAEGPRASELRARLEREGRLLARLDHPRIVRLLETGETADGEPFIAMELVRGRAVSRAIPLPARRALEVARDVAEALSHAHERGVVHRDVKPANILLDEEGRGRLTDLGIARLLGTSRPVNALGSTGSAIASDAALTGAGRVAGTERYLAPEALAGAPPDPRQDVYALGVVLHECATGLLPVGAFEPAPPPLGAIAARAMAQDPARRTPSARTLAAEIDGAISALDDLERGAVPPEERLFTRAAALVLSVATATALWALVECVRPRVLEPGDLRPLVMLDPEPLPGGRLLSRARFETGPVLAALGAGAVAALVLGLLSARRRSLHLLRREPDLPLAEARPVLVAGAIAFAVYVLRGAVELGLPHLVASPAGRAVRAYVPILGGGLLVTTLVLAWLAILEAIRVERPLTREWRFWAGLACAVTPPALELAFAMLRGAP